MIEEIRNELQITGNSKKAGYNISRPGYVDPFSRFDAVEAAKLELKGDQKFIVDDEDDLIQVNYNKAKAMVE